ncbi:putative trafficking protein particle complex subunit 2 [Capsicum baccatum]|uniref:Trafficking protein particle complex subunit 2 n=1 Tax=Capsicum baccatum TaxID=33114 RepID=A0A2G2WLL1_CAPBA|nr:putative trafficking protein particle complex subunit 2 [Capsicum baccatum]
MASTACFMIVSRNDIPIYEAEVGTAPKKEDAAHQHQFILHAALDIVQDLAWTTSAMFLKSIDRFNDLVVSVYVTAGHILHIIVIHHWLPVPHVSQMNLLSSFVFPVDSSCRRLVLIAHGLTCEVISCSRFSRKREPIFLNLYDLEGNRSPSTPYCPPPHSTLCVSLSLSVNNDDS